MRLISKINIIIIAVVMFLGMCKASQIKAYDEPIVYNNGIVYPIDLNTGKDSSGKIVIPDTYFLNYLKSAKLNSGNYRGYNFDFNEDGYLTKEESENVREIDVEENKEIKDLKGIEAFVYLKSLYCSNTGISKLDLSMNSEIEDLFAGDNDIKELNLSNLTKLKSLYVPRCKLPILDTSHNSKISYLYLGTQKTEGNEYKEGKWYKYCIKDLNPYIDLSRVSNPRIENVKGDGINSGYDATTGTFWCSDIMHRLTYDYNVDIRNDNDLVKKMEVNVYTSVGERDEYNPGETIIPAGEDNEEADSDYMYFIKHETNLTAAQIKDATGNFEFEDTYYFRWRQAPVFFDFESIEVPGYHLEGWYMDKKMTKKITYVTEYKDLYRSQFSGKSEKNIPKMYAKYVKNNYTIKFDTGCKMKIGDIKKDWGDGNLVPTTKLKKKKHRFYGWEIEGKIFSNKKVKKMLLNDKTASYANKNKAILVFKAVWQKKKFKYKKATFKLLKGNKVKLINAKGKKRTIKKKFKYNGINYKITKVDKKLKKKIKLK